MNNESKSASSSVGISSDNVNEEVQGNKKSSGTEMAKTPMNTLNTSFSSEHSKMTYKENASLEKRNEIFASLAEGNETNEINNISNQSEICSLLNKEGTDHMKEMIKTNKLDIFNASEISTARVMIDMFKSSQDKSHKKVDRMISDVNEYEKKEVFQQQRKVST
jgi:hypothetical protein